jgi:hypothetical protein
LEPLEIETAYGGLFYLVNVALALELYHDFSAPLAQEIDLPIWDFLALMGEAFVGEVLYADPLWGLLARLSGREYEQPGYAFTPPGGESLNSWVSAWAERLRTRLLAALDLDDPAQLPAVLCVYHARVLVTAARVDIVLRLDELSIAVRLAGLDRNPGWVPVAGRTLEFHFE